MSNGASLGSGNLYVVMGYATNVNPASITVTTMVAGGTTYTLGTELTLAPGCSMGFYNRNNVPICEYVLPSVSTGGTTPITLNFSAALANSSSQFYVIEVAPSANGSLVGLSNDTMQYQATALAIQPGPTFTTTGINPYTVTGMTADNGSNVTDVASPYAIYSPLYGIGNVNPDGFAAAIGSAPASWTIAGTAGAAFGNSMVFSWSPTAYKQGYAMNFSGATSGTALSAANLSTSMQGWEGAPWIESGTASTLFSSAAARTVLSSFGPLNDGSTLLGGTTPNGVQFTSSGANTDSWQITVGNGYTAQIGQYKSPFSLGLWYSNTASCTGATWNFDTVAVGSYGGGTNDFLNERNNNGAGVGTCNFAIETLLGVTNIVTDIPYIAGNWYWFDYLFNGQSATATFTNGSAIIGATNSFVSGDIVNFTTTGGLPTNFATSTDYCISATNLSASQFSVGLTCGGALRTAGSSGTGAQTVVKAHTIKIYNATNITGATCTGGTTTLTTAGLPTDGNVVTGKTIYLENVTPSVWNGTFASITVSGNNVSYSQTCPGSAYSTGGAIVALVGQQDSAAEGGTPYWGYDLFGVREAIPTGAVANFGYMKQSFTGIDPLLP